MLLFGFDIFPAFDVLGFLKSEQSKLGVIIGKGILQRLLASHASLLAHYGYLLLRHRGLSLLSNVLVMRGHLCRRGLMLRRELMSHDEDDSRCEGQTTIQLSA